MNDIELEGLSVSYGKDRCRQALDSLNLTVKKGDIFGFLGPNGAGKTTTIKAILGLIPSYAGRVSVLGGSPGDPRVKGRIGYMPEIAHYYWYLTPKELLRMYAGIFGIKGRKAAGVIDNLIDIVDLAPSGDRMMKTFSKGMMQKVSFAQALINDPELLILDEPASGLDPIARIKMKDIIKRYRDRGKTIFFSSHELSEVETISDEIAVVKDGATLMSGRTGELLVEKGGGVSLERFFIDIIRGGKDDGGGER